MSAGTAVIREAFARARAIIDLAAGCKADFVTVDPRHPAIGGGSRRCAESRTTSPTERPDGPDRHDHRDRP